MKRLAIVALLTFLAGCAGPIGGKPTYATQTEFDPKEAGFIFTQGSGQISGRAFIRDQSRIRVAAGSKVTLVPATRYAEERVKLIYGTRKMATTGVSFSKPDKRYYAFTRSTMANEQGEFVFRNIGPGTYFVTTSVLWKDPSVRGGKGGGALIQKVELGDGEKKEVALSAVWG